MNFLRLLPSKCQLLEYCLFATYADRCRNNAPSVIAPSCRLFLTWRVEKVIQYCIYTVRTVRYHSGGSMELNACILLLAHTQFRLLTTFNIQTVIIYMYTDWQHNYGAIPLSFTPLANPLLLQSCFSFTYLETLLGVIGSRPPWPQVTRKLTSPFPSLPHRLPIPNSQHPGALLN